MNRVKEINRVFLSTILILIPGSYLSTLLYDASNNYLLVLLLSQFVLILPTLIYLLIKKVNIRKLIRFNSIRLSNVVLLIVFSYLILPLMNLINAISMMYVQNDTATIISDIANNNSFYLTLFMVAFIPAVLEEAVYRGVFYNEYRKVNTIKGILLSGFLFGIMHGNINQFSYAFVMGMVFALLIEATNSIVSSMIVHFIINGTSVVLLYLYPKLLTLMENIYGSSQFNANEIMEQINSSAGQTLTFDVILSTYGIPAIICTFLAFVVLKTIAKNEGRWEGLKEIIIKKKMKDNSNEGVSTNTNKVADEEYELKANNVTEDEKALVDSSKKSLFTPSLIIAIIICIVIMIRYELYSIESISSGVDEFLIQIKNIL